MKTFYLYKANFNTTCFGFSFMEEALDDIFKQGYTDEVEIYSYKASHGEVEDDKRKDLKLIVSASDMKYVFQDITNHRNLLIAGLVKKNAQDKRKAKV